MKTAIRQVQREAALLGYDPTFVQTAEFAILAFLDETILSSKEPKADDWRRKPLTVELHGQAMAGVEFFNKLENVETQPDSPAVADLLEVFLLCLLLGFEGRYAPPLQSESLRIMDRLRSRIDSIHRADYRLSPPIPLPIKSQTAKASSRSYLWILLLPMLSLAIFLGFTLVLSSRIGQLNALMPK